MRFTDSWKQHRFILFWQTSRHIFTHFCFAVAAIVQRSRSPSDDLLQFAEMDTFGSVSTISLLAPSWQRSWAHGGQASIYLHLSLSLSRSLPLSLSLSEGAGAVWPLTFSIPLRCLWVLNGGLRGAEASAWFSRVKTKRLLKIPRSSHDPRKDLDPTCVRFPFHALGHKKVHI